MHSIGSAHAEVRSRRRETSLASTTDRILLIIGIYNNGISWYKSFRLGRSSSTCQDEGELGRRADVVLFPNSDAYLVEFGGFSSYRFHYSPNYSVLKRNDFEAVKMPRPSACTAGGRLVGSDAIWNLGEHPKNPATGGHLKTTLLDLWASAATPLYPCPLNEGLR
jgi:hypothetical protein